MNKNKLTLSSGILIVTLAVLIGGTFSGETNQSQASSDGNTVTTGGVSISLQDISHVYQSGDMDPTDFALDTSDGLSFALGNLLPLDSGDVKFELENGAGDTRVCVKLEENPALTEGQGASFASRLAFAFEDQDDSGYFSDIQGRWQNLTTADADETIQATIGYCFGQYDSGACVLDNTDYNPAQRASLGVDATFKAVQKEYQGELFDCERIHVANFGFTVGGTSQSATCPMNSPCELVWTIGGKVGGGEPSFSFAPYVPYLVDGYDRKLSGDFEVLFYFDGFEDMGDSTVLNFTDGEAEFADVVIRKTGGSANTNDIRVQIDGVERAPEPMP